LAEILAMDSWPNNTEHYWYYWALFIMVAINCQPQIIKLQYKPIAQTNIRPSSNFFIENLHITSLNLTPRIYGPAMKNKGGKT